MDNRYNRLALTLLILAILANPAVAQKQSSPSTPSSSGLVAPLQKASEAFGRLITSPIDERIKKDRIARQPQIGNTMVQRSTRECMKPGNVIDDEVLRCIRGE